MAGPFKFDPEDQSKPSPPNGLAEAGNNGSEQPAPWPEPQPLENYLFPVLPMSKKMLPDPSLTPLLIGRMMSVIECAVHSTSPPPAPSS